MIELVKHAHQLIVERLQPGVSVTEQEMIEKVLAGLDADLMTR